MTDCFFKKKKKTVLRMVERERPFREREIVWKISGVGYQKEITIDPIFEFQNPNRQEREECRKNNANCSFTEVLWKLKRKKQRW